MLWRWKSSGVIHFLWHWSSLTRLDLLSLYPSNLFRGHRFFVYCVRTRKRLIDDFMNTKHVFRWQPVIYPKILLPSYLEGCVKLAGPTATVEHLIENWEAYCNLDFLDSALYIQVHSSI